MRVARVAAKSLQEARILLVDDDAAVLAVLKEWFALFDCAVDCAADGIPAMTLARANAYDIIITDVHMPAMDGHQLRALLKELQPDAQVIFLSGSSTIEDAILALREGQAFDFLLKPIRDLKQLNQVIERALAHQATSRVTRVEPKPEHLEPLSAREAEIVALLVQGLDNASMADRLCLSEKTIKNNLTRIYEKLKVDNRTQAVLACQTYGLIR